MQMCGFCQQIYDEAESMGCPTCENVEEDYTHVIVFDKDECVAKSVPKEDAHLYD